MMLMVLEGLILLHQQWKNLDTKFNWCCSWMGARLAFLFCVKNILSSVVRAS